MLWLGAAFDPIDLSLQIERCVQEAGEIYLVVPLAGICGRWYRLEIVSCTFC